MKLDSIDFHALAERFGTPYYLYDIDQVLAHIDLLRSELSDCADIYYAVKANANPSVLRALVGHVDGLDVSSAGEASIAASAGHPPQNMSFAGPGKTDRDMNAALSLGIGLISVESVTQLRCLSSAAISKNKTASIALRINPLSTSKEFAMRMGGTHSQFGIAEEDSSAVVIEAQKTPGVRIDAIHVFSGTQCLEIGGIVSNVENTLRIANALCEKHKLSLTHVNIGGGFGIPYFEGQSEMNANDLNAAVGNTLRHASRRFPYLKNVRFIVELGRYIIGPYGVYVAKVIDIKETRGKRFAIIDGGMHHCFPATGFFGQLVKKNYPVLNLSDHTREAIPQEIVGSLCTPMDSMARNISIPRLEIGDLVGIMSAGAYCFSASPLLFLGHNTPYEIVRLNNNYSVSRSPIETTNLF